VEAIAQERADVAVGWSAFGHLEPGRIQILPLPPEHSVSRGTGIALLKFSRQPKAATQFMDFLTTPAARACYVEFGWEL
jgi:accessory colonization factor AcfC